jgi:hypothetical protein
MMRKGTAFQRIRCRYALAERNEDIHCSYSSGTLPLEALPLASRRVAVPRRSGSALLGIPSLYHKTQNRDATKA